MSTAATPTAVRAAEVAILGNPNTGKTSLFNDLTGMRQRVGNYPGITVEKKVGILKLEGRDVELIDLPGTYSLAAASLDERVVVDVLTGHIPGTRLPEVVVFVADACNLHRNLFLASQVADLGIPVVIALNLVDAAEKRGIKVNASLLSQRLGVPVIPTIATEDVGIPELKRAIEQALNEKALMKAVEWPQAVRDAVADLRQAIRADLDQDLTDTELRRILFDANSAILERLKWFPSRSREAIEKAREHLRNAGFNPLAAEALVQYEHLGKVLDGVVQKRGEADSSQSESIDNLMIHRVWGLLIFVGMMFVVFQAVYFWAEPLMNLIDAGKSWVQGAVGPWFDGMPTLQSLVTDGVIEGVGAFVIFLPQILILFLFIALLEDTGYMSRAAFLMDKLFHWCGLNGKSFVPLLSSYACAVPGIMATRTIEDPKARLTTILLAPLMSCSARLPVYVLLIGAFVAPTYGPFWAGVSLFLMHFVGLAVAIPLAFIFTRFVVKTKVQPFFLEMPPYRVPRMRNVLFRMYEAGKEFVERAGTVILAITVIVWALLYFPRPAEVETNVTQIFIARQVASGMAESQVQEELAVADSGLAVELADQIDSAYVNQSILGRLGRAVQPVFNAAGFDWKITVGVLASFPAREVIISTLGVIYTLGGDVDEEDPDLRKTLRDSTWQEGPREGQPVFTLPVVFGIMVFFALCSQCGSTLAVIAKESNWKWAAFVFLYMTTLAWVAAVAVYQVGTALMT